MPIRVMTQTHDRTPALLPRRWGPFLFGMNIIIQARDYPLRDIRGISLSDAIQGHDLSIRALGALLKIQRNDPIDDKDIEAILAYGQFCLPSILRCVLESQIRSQTISVALE